MSVYLVIQAEKCTGCRICEIFCSFHHEGAIWPERARLMVLAEMDDGPFAPNPCRQCGARQGELAPCAEVCPVEAISLDERIGAWLVDAEICIGCGACQEACPYGIMRFDPQAELAYKCDLCGGAPECAAMCPTGAISLEEG